MNGESSIEQQLETELARFKTAVDFIEQAQQTVQQSKQLNEDNQTKYIEDLQSNKEFKAIIDLQIFELERRLNTQLHTELTSFKNAVHLMDQAKHIVKETQKFNAELQSDYQEALQTNYEFKEKINLRVSELEELEKRIEKKIHTELSCLKTSFEYIEQAKLTVQETIKSYNEFKGNLNLRISELEKRLEKQTNDMNKLSSIVKAQSETINNIEKDIERFKSLKWYQKLF